MIPLFKLERLPTGQRRRKLVKILTEWERRLYSAHGKGVSSFDASWIIGVLHLVLEDSAINAGALNDADRALLELPSSRHAGISAQELLRLCNHGRHALVHATGVLPADWDFVHPVTGVPDERSFNPGMLVYAEDLRSPFNMGSVFRTAEAFGAERVLLSPGCVSPEHPRSARSAMGCVEYLPWERRSLGSLPSDLPVFALETGGTPIREFRFPLSGVVIIGSEELGVSPEALELATYGRVSIPMTGIKASLNVGVAFGILMAAWSDYLPRSVSNAR